MPLSPRQPVQKLRLSLFGCFLLAKPFFCGVFIHFQTGIDRLFGRCPQRRPTFECLDIADLCLFSGSVAVRLLKLSCVTISVAIGLNELDGYLDGRPISTGMLNSLMPLDLPVSPICENAKCVGIEALKFSRKIVRDTLGVSLK